MASGQYIVRLRKVTRVDNVTLIVPLCFVHVVLMLMQTAGVLAILVVSFPASLALPSVCSFFSFLYAAGYVL